MVCIIAAPASILYRGGHRFLKVVDSTTFGVWVYKSTKNYRNNLHWETRHIQYFLLFSDNNPIKHHNQQFLEVSVWICPFVWPNLQILPPDLQLYMPLSLQSTRLLQDCFFMLKVVDSTRVNSQKLQPTIVDPLSIYD